MSYISGIFPSTFLQLVNGSKNSILNWVLKLNHFSCSKCLKYFLFYSPIHLSDFSSRKCIFQWSSGDLNFKNPHGYHELSNNQTVKKLNLQRKTALDKSAWIKACIYFLSKVFYMIKWTKGFFISCDDIVSEEFRVIFNFIFIFALHKKWSFYVKTS